MKKILLCPKCIEQALVATCPAPYIKNGRPDIQSEGDVKYTCKRCEHETFTPIEATTAEIKEIILGLMESLECASGGLSEDEASDMKAWIDSLSS